MFCRAYKFMNSFHVDIFDIKSELEAYYAADFDSEEANSAESSRILVRLENLINNANKELATKEFLQLKNQVLGLFSEIPRCIEGDVLFLSLIGNLLKNGVLSKEEVRNILDAPAPANVAVAQNQSLKLIG
jgi:hypothetical protein